MNGFVTIDVEAPYIGPDLPVTVYALVDPRDSTVRYIGQTMAPVARLSCHLSNVSSTAEERRDWMAELLASGSRPVMVTLERCSVEESASRESYWISFYRSRGRLYNAEHAATRVNNRFKPRPRNIAVTVRFTVDEMADIKAAADGCSLDVATWLRMVSVEAARAGKK